MDFNELFAWVEGNARISFSRSGGPGGQNVNKVNTKATLRIRPVGIPDISDEQLELLRSRLGNRINEAGELVVHASEKRTQLGNRRAAVERTASLIHAALRPEAKRKKTRPGRAAHERRLQQKKRTAQRKSMRRPPQPE